MTEPLFLVDTSLWILAHRQGAKGVWLEELRALITQRRILINPIIRLELLSGTRSEKEFTELLQLLNALPLLEITEPVWHEAERTGFLLRRKGITIPITDVIIAASAILHNCLLYHHDRHFTLIAQHSSLKQKTL